jgi:hypothetical protein
MSVAIYNFFESTDVEGAIFEDLNQEYCELFGLPIYFIPRKNVKLDYLLGEDPLQKFPDKYLLYGYFKFTDAWEGMHNYSKFGLLESHELEVDVTRKSFLNTTGIEKPFIGDLLCIEWTKNGEDTKTLWEITFVDPHTPFYYLGKVPMWPIKAKRWQQSYETTIADAAEEAQKTIDNNDFMSDNLNLDFDAQDIII